MAAKRPRTGIRSRKDLRSHGDQGQSVLEFLLMLPMMIILTVMMLKVNTAIQMSLVNQKYARAHMFFMAANSPYFPALEFRESAMTSKGFNQMIVGVSEKEVSGTQTRPIASKFSITRAGIQGSEENETPQLRSNVRIRTTVAMCSQQNVLPNGAPILDLRVAAGKFEASGKNQLNEGTSFDLCRSPYK